MATKNELKNPDPPKSGAIDALLDLLGGKTFLYFGYECASVMVWMVALLLIRSLLSCVGILSIVPHGFVYAFPAFIQFVSSIFPFMDSLSFPILPIRITETVLGRHDLSLLAIIIPAHFLGCVLGLAAFKLILPVAPAEILVPAKFDRSSTRSMCIEGLVVCFFIIFVTVIPELLRVNRISKYYLSIPVSLLILGASIGAGLGQGCTYNPVPDTALWFAQGKVSVDQALLQLETFIGPFVGAIVAGLFCSKYFPEDRNSWRRV